ncbi:MAG TPA: PQQ-binding-like beta-propeller repeat protein [Stellaceae bacterium]|jgi:outer membrane protein assembly factor BamB|nr:PQQ-binding-like beta-propeller repeat protein [Stellaceae bacterium]
MNRRQFSSVLLASLTTAGCGLFGDKPKARLPGDRISVLGLDHAIQPDPALANRPINLPPPNANPDWPEPGGNPSHSMGNLALPNQVKKAWETNIGDGSARYTKVMSQPVVAQGRAFAMDGGVQVSALDTAGGKKFWQVDLKPEDQKGNAFGGGPCFWNGRLFVATGYAEVMALDPNDGRVIWRKNVSSPVHAAPTVVDNRVFVVTVDNELIALSAEDGTRQWSHNGIPETGALLGSASPAVEGEIVVVAYSSGELFALRVENGRSLWSENLAAARNLGTMEGMADIHGRPVIDRGRVFAVSHSGRMMAIELRTGNHVWEQELGGSHEPCCAGDYIFIIANNGELICLTRDEGKVRWATDLPPFENMEKRKDPIQWAGPVLGGGQLIVLSSSGVAMWISPDTGESPYQTKMSDKGFLGPVIAGNTLFLLTDDANLSAYR